jgi:hypothetical protein
MGNKIKSTGGATKGKASALPNIIFNGFHLINKGVLLIYVVFG